MIVKFRIEAEAPTLDEVVKDIEAAAKAAKLPKELYVHDEHYERSDGPLFKGRRVYGHGPKAPKTSQPFAYGQIAQTSGTGYVVKQLGNAA